MRTLFRSYLRVARTLPSLSHSYQVRYQVGNIIQVNAIPRIFHQESYAIQCAHHGYHSFFVIIAFANSWLYR
jgi:hypothetical protein